LDEIRVYISDGSSLVVEIFPFSKFPGLNHQCFKIKQEETRKNAVEKTAKENGRKNTVKN